MAVGAAVADMVAAAAVAVIGNIAKLTLDFRT
jgi:hypothetical protein